ncbi:MAG: tetratricopeptide repeat protein [Candidatus Hodarchaeota archaeon]
MYTNQNPSEEPNLTAKFPKDFSKIEELLSKGQYQEVLQRIEVVLQKARKNENLLFEFDALILKAEANWRLGRHEEGYRFLIEGEGVLAQIETQKLVDSTEIQRRKARLRHHEGIFYWFRGDLEKAIDSHQQSLRIKTELGDRRGMARSFNNLGLVYWSKGDLRQSLNYYQQSLVINEELGDKRDIAVTLTNMGNAYTRLGDLEKALELQNRSLTIREELGNKHDIALSIINLGAVFQLKGDLNQALECYQRGLVLFEDLGIKRDIALALNNLGNIFEWKGDLDRALDYFQRSLDVYEELGYTENIALLLSNIGEVHRKKGNPETAQEYYQQGLTIFSAMENDPLMAVILLELIWVGMEKEDSSLIEESLDRLKQINERNDNPVIDQHYRIATALVLKQSNRVREKMQAETILQEVVNEAVVNHSLTVTAMIHLCDLLISELKMTGEEELFGEIKNLTEQLLNIAEQQASQFLLTEIYLLQSKLALIELDMGQAKKLLAKALQIANEKGLDGIARTVNQEYELLQSQVQKWELIIQQNPSKQEMIDQTKLDDLLGKMIQETVTALMEERGISGALPKKKYNLEYHDFLKDSSKTVKHHFRVGIAQIGLSQNGDILNELYQEQAPGLFGLQGDKVGVVKETLRNMVEQASSEKVNILILPELTVDLNYPALQAEVLNLAKSYNMYLIPGSYHDSKTKQNWSIVVSPEGILWKQEKHIPAIIHFENKRITEGIDTSSTPRTIIVGNTEYGRIAIVLCRDFLDMDLRVDLKNFDPPIDLIINPAFTPVTADFKAAHFDARRSIYAYCFFANVAEFGDSLIYTPEKDRTERTIPPREENLIYKDIDLFQLRSERKKWDLEQKKKHGFIQSTR